MTDQSRSEVVRWVAVAPRWLGHRPEPLIHERLWACPLVLEDDARAVRWAGIDAVGRIAALRDSYPDSPPSYPDYVERVEFEAHAVVVYYEQTVLVRTELDDDGRPLRSLYPSQGDEERYRYDREGRLIEITGSMAAVGAGSGSRGPLVVEHDARGPSAIRTGGHTVWERIDEPWPDVLARGAREIADGLIESVRARVAPPGVEVFALSLTYVDDSLHSMLSFGLEEERRAWLAGGLSDEELALRLWYLIDPERGLGEIEDYGVPSDLEDLLLREASLKQPEDPCRTVLNEVAALLARHDWNGLVRPTDDFVVFIAEHDEGYAPKYESVRAVNPAERLARWEARWPLGVSRGEDEEID